MVFNLFWNEESGDAFFHEECSVCEFEMECVQEPALKHHETIFLASKTLERERMERFWLLSSAKGVVSMV